MRDYIAYGLILIVVVGIALAWRVSASQWYRDHKNIHYRITPREDDDDTP